MKIPVYRHPEPRECPHAQVCTAIDQAREFLTECEVDDMKAVWGLDHYLGGFVVGLLLGIFVASAYWVCR